MQFRRAAAFAFLAGLALAVLAVGTGVLAAQASSFSAAGEVIYGERAAAEGFTLRQELALGGHLSVDAVFDAASGETRSDSAWSFLELAPEEAPAGSKLRLKGVGGDRDESWPDRGHNTLSAPLAWAQDIYDRLYSSLDGESGQAGESRPLSEYTDKLPLNFYCRGMTDDVPVYEIRPEDPRLWCDRRVNETYDGELSDGAFALPLTGDEMLYASVTVNSYACAFGVEASPGADYYTYSDCVLAPDGALYLVLDIRETDGGTPGERVSAEGFPALFSDPTKLPLVIVTIFAFSMSDTFDTLGTFIGTGRRTGIFSAEDEKALENGHGFSSKMDKALFADSIATSIGAICGTSNTTTYVESSAGIAAGGRTGLTSVVVAICFALSAFLAPVVSAVPSAATAGVLVIVGCMMAASLKEVKWDDIAEAIPAFFAAVFMAFSYSISYGIAGGFIMYCIVKTCKGKAKEVHPIIWTVAALFILDFVCMAIL